MTFVLEDSGNPKQSDTMSLSIVINEPPYVCGDADGNKRVDFSDAVFIVNYIFANGSAPDPVASADVDCNLRLDIGDAVFLVNYFFNNLVPPCAGCK